jgi:2-amino-4-hydroxy-6-hydroxymethyldihydropteridine diphosphokinase
MMQPAYIGLGANQGDARETLEAALEALRVLEKSELVAVSPFYLSAPIEAEGPDFLNAVARLDTALEPYALLLHLLDLELMLGRKRRGAKRNAPRSVDLDLLLYGAVSLQSAPLTLPHPRMHQRAFVLRPLADLAPGLLVPQQGRVEALLAAVADQRVEPCPAPSA